MGKFNDLVNLGKELGFRVNVYEVERYNGDKTYKADVVVGKILFLFPDRRYLEKDTKILSPSDLYQGEFNDKESLLNALEVAINKYYGGKRGKVKKVKKIKVGLED